MSFGIPVRNGLGVGLLASTFLSSLRIGGRPAMSLDFIGTNSLDSRITFTRGTTATFVGSNGFIQSAAINTPRFGYDPVTLAPRGLLIEEQRTNFVLQSNVLSSNSDVTVTADVATSPDGTTNAYRTTKANATDPVYSSKTTSMTVTANTAYTASRFVKYDGFNTVVSLEYNVGANWGDVFWNAQFAVASTGVTVFSLNSCTGTVQNFGNGWYRVTATFTTGGTIVTPSNPSILLRITGGSGVSVLGYGVQLEAGAFATNYIPTVASTATRNADVAVMTGTNFSSWYNQTEGTFVAQFSGPSGGYALNANDGTNNNATGIVYLTGTTLRGITVAAGTGRFVDMTASASPAVNKTAYGYKLNDLGGSTNGGAVLTNTSAVIPTLDRMFIGTFSNFSFLNGHIRAITYYNTRLPNTQLRVLST
jgi:hypothetical protein